MPTQSIKIKAPIQTVYDCIVDFESYPQFLSEMKSTKINWCEDKEIEVKFKINLIKEITYTLHFDLEPPTGVYWKLKSGDMMKSNTGSWELKELGNDLTEAQYMIDIDFSLWVPKVITNTLVEKNLPQTLKAFRKRSEKQFQSSSSTKG